MDDVKGEIIGGDFYKWLLIYDGRRQASGWAEDKDSAISAAETKCDELIAAYSGYPCYLYSDDDLWAIFVEQG
jgi:hypothetical protein